ncbi:FtsX-like permease family protein [Cellulomonas sp. KH9]|uniref:FtsX-like permease family protein n=1 Tax=Cellulomonas sp. KH9 TaxID=1855324 RepID=UPI0008EE1DC4|nr:FtsX-like permease family protein [Cellulomonas sp. KH9]SFJ68046.1 FtsX-like permease family protein [Cellulomonas sp. KH9]
MSANPVLALAPRLQRAGGRDGRTTTALAATAFTVSTALTLSVVGALTGFVERAAHPVTELEREAGSFYVVLAVTATILLVVPLLTLGGAAARLGVARRDARLAALRLLGATPREVVGLALVETALQGLAGAVAGTALYGALLPVWTQVPFQGRAFTAGELWVGVPVVLAAWVAVPLLAAVSGAVSLRRVVVSPLGVAQRTTRPGLRAVRVVVAVVAVGAFMVVSAVGQMAAAVLITVLLTGLALAFLTMNAVGPWVLGVLGRLQLRWARTPAQLLAARRLLDDPRAVWRVVGGLGLASFVAGCLAVVPVLAGGGGDPVGDVVARDLLTGALLTLGITFLLAAASAGIAQAAAVLDRRRELALARLAGVPGELFDQVRRREVLVPLLVVSVGSAVAALVMFFPLFGLAAVTAPSGILLLVGCLGGGVAMVLAATEASRPLLRRVLADTVVRAD